MRLYAATLQMTAGFPATGVVCLRHSSDSHRRTRVLSFVNNSRPDDWRAATRSPPSSRTNADDHFLQRPLSIRTPANARSAAWTRHSLVRLFVACVPEVLRHSWRMAVCSFRLNAPAFGTPDEDHAERIDAERYRLRPVMGTEGTGSKIGRGHGGTRPRRARITQSTISTGGAGLGATFDSGQAA